ncbi:uncharacterized protein LOC130743906 [Lotus japonicus]|uniref:uncharacterized protein LOC130743906 n=1 Tax=Lotus japonicus TaxID=34305 RepID=UPI002586FE90|nr:uncharacterized protein LOC130743906 [Lotus japonicus]
MELTGCTSNVNGDKKSVRVTASVGSLGSLQEIAKLMPQEHQKSFNRKYGRLLDLLSIRVEESALTALTHYWNSSLRCFEFPTFDITPTIEEYACILDIPMNEGDAYYFPMDQPPSESKVREQFKGLLGLSEKQSRMSGHTGSRGLNRACMEDRMASLAQHNEWEGFSKILALEIYGLVLFPSATDIIDLAAMDVFYSVEDKARNPVPTVLAETFLTLTFCHHKGKGKLQCCLQLLYVWAMSHLHVGKQISRGSKALNVFCHLTIKSLDERRWKNEFESAEENQFLRWVPPWYDSKQGKVIIFNCGEFPYVPLMGPKGCVT